MDGPWEATDKDLSGFRFTITGGDEATNAAITAGTVVLPQSVTATSDADGNFNLEILPLMRRELTNHSQ